MSFVHLHRLIIIKCYENPQTFYGLWRCESAYHRFSCVQDVAVEHPGCYHDLVINITHQAFNTRQLQNSKLHYNYIEKSQHSVEVTETHMNDRSHHPH